MFIPSQIEAELRMHTFQSNKIKYIHTIFDSPPIHDENVSYFSSLVEEHSSIQRIRNYIHQADDPRSLFARSLNRKRRKLEKNERDSILTISALSSALESQCQEITHLFLTEYAHLIDFNVVDGSGNSYLHLAVIYGTPDVVTRILELNPDQLHKPNFFDETPLQYIFEYTKPRLDVIRILVERGGASIERINYLGRTVLMVATKQGHRAIVDYLMEKGANIHALDEDGNSLMHYAAVSDDAAIIRCFADAGLSIHARNKEVETPLHVAAYRAASNSVQQLLEMGADALAADNLNNLPIFYVAELEEGTVVKRWKCLNMLRYPTFAGYDDPCHRIVVEFIETLLSDVREFWDHFVWIFKRFYQTDTNSKNELISSVLRELAPEQRSIQAAYLLCLHVHDRMEPLTRTLTSQDSFTLNNFAKCVESPRKADLLVELMNELKRVATPASFHQIVLDFFENLSSFWTGWGRKVAVRFYLLERIIAMDGIRCGRIFTEMVEYDLRQQHTLFNEWPTPSSYLSTSSMQLALAFSAFNRTDEDFWFSERNEKERSEIYSLKFLCRTVIRGALLTPNPQQDDLLFVQRLMTLPLPKRLKYYLRFVEDELYNLIIALEEDPVR